MYDYACVRVALRENITDILMNYPNGIHVDELSKVVEIEPKKLARVLRLLATRGCYNEGRSYTLSVKGWHTYSSFQWRLTRLRTTVCL